MFSDNTISKCFLCNKYIMLGPCEVHDEVGFKVVNIINGLDSVCMLTSIVRLVYQLLTINPIASMTSYKSAIPPLPGSPRVRLGCLLLEYRGHICDADGTSLEIFR